MRFLVVGQGAREHALVRALGASDHVGHTAICLPGCRQIALNDEADSCIRCSLDDHATLITAARDLNISHAIIGPEAPLVDGLADSLRLSGIATVGPGQEGARLEGSKSWMKSFADRHDIPTARFAVFDDEIAAITYIRKQEFPIVVKADGLAAGKGVTIASNSDEAINAVHVCMAEERFGRAGQRVIIEEYLEGHEVSYFALRDRNTIYPFGEARDHKRLREGDQGPNTGGMGCISTSDLITPDERNVIYKAIVLPLHNGLNADGIPYQGVLFFGLMMTRRGPYLLEMNCRFGDPECQTLLMRFKGDIAVVLDNLAHETLARLPPVAWHTDPAISIVVARRGYPNHTPDQHPSPLDNLKCISTACGPDIHIWHSSVSRDAVGRWQAHSGRVLSIGARAASLDDARAKVLNMISLLDWPDAVFRRDIGCT